MTESLRGAATILLVEDNTDDERIALRALRRHAPDVRVEVARDGEEALKTLGLDGAGRTGGFDLILCDLKLPKLRGDEVLRHVRAADRLNDVPFVVFSSADFPGEEAECVALGAVEYVVKPIGYEEYGQSLKRIVERYLDATPLNPADGWKIAMAA